MNTSNYTYVRCPECQGFGVQVQQNNQQCTNCYGEGGWIQTENGVRLVYLIPKIITSSSRDELRMHAWLITIMTSLSFIILAFSLIALISQEGIIPLNLIWKTGPLHAVFGISGLTSMVSILILQTRKSSEHSLRDLDADIGLHTGDLPLSLNAYANERIEALLRECAITARKLGSPEIDETVLLITLLQEPRIIVMIARMERSVDTIIESLTTLLHRQEGGNHLFPVMPSVRDRIYSGIEEALKHNFSYIDLEDIMLAYLDNPAAFASTFKQEDIDYASFYAVSRWYAEDQDRASQWKFWLEKGRTRPHGYMNRAWTALPTPYLDQYSIDLTRRAANGNVPTVTIRDMEIDAILRVLGRTNKNSVLLVGEPGVGKESTLGAVALRMIEEQVPEVLKDKRLLSVDLGAMLSTGNSPENNLQRALDEIATAGNVILAVPDIHVLVGTSGGGALDAASILAGAINNNTVQLISTATPADYHRYVESSANLSALLDVVQIKEPTIEQSITILEEEAPNIEGRQHVHLTYPAIEAAVTLAHRYFPEQVLPGSAIALLDETASANQLAKQHWVTKSEIEKMVESKTQIPVQQADEQEATLLLNLEVELHKRIVGQEEAVKAVSEALRRARAGLHDDKRPIASFLFVGPTGVGKTETAKAISDLYFGGKSSMIRLDMSEYQGATAIYSLIGPPASSPDSYTEGGALTTPVREHPFSLILLDELEKANGDVLNLFLQLLDDGRLTENTGRTVFYNNSIVIATSNAGSADIAELLRSGSTPDQLRTKVAEVLQKQFRPEFLNRFDSIIPFHALRQDEIKKIAGLMLEEVIAKAASQKIGVSFTDEAISKIGTLGFDAAYGARPLRHFIQDKVEGLLATAMLDKSLQAGQSLEITADMIQ